MNGNNQLDADEPSGTTDPNGYFQVDSFTLPTVGVAKVVSMGGTDIITGKALPDLALVSDVPTDTSQPANVTPLTTVISAATTPEEKAQVLSALGISGSVEELLTSDGWAKAEAGDENAKANQRLNQQVGLLLQTATTLTDDGDESTDVSVALAQSVAKQISAVAQSEGSVDLTASATIILVLTDAAQEVTPSIDVAASAIEAVADAVATVNTVVADVTLDPLSDMAKEIVEAAQDSLQTSVLDVVSGAVSVDSFAEETGAAKLFENVAVVADAPDNDGDGIPDALDPDDDNDNISDTVDAFPLDSTESIDTDSDGTGNNADTDDDGDGVADEADAFPLDSTETVDTDSDGVGNNADTDDDGDGVADEADAFPLDSTESIDTDSDGVGNNADTDDDGDGVADEADAFPLDSTETVDTDSDGVGNNADTDDDGDGVADEADAFPLDSTESIDTDSDGVGNNADTDDDGDGVADEADAFPLDSTESIDTDSDGVGNNADTDDDGDGVADEADAFPLDSTESIDTDSDGVGNNADTDDDGDGVADEADAFPLDSTESIDTDSDGVGNNADTDDDGDGVADEADAFPLDSTESIDTDSDGVGNSADTDDDGDGVADEADAFPLDSTESIDTDSDGIGDNADTNRYGDDSVIVGRWKLANEAGSFGVGSKAGDPDWWTPNDNDLTARACFMDDVYIFGEYGSFANEQGDQTWLENWQSGSDDACGAPLAPHNGSVDGTFTYADNKITITGAGNYIGIAKAGNTYAYESGGVPASIEYTVESMNADKTAMTLAVKVTKDDGNIDYWTYKLVKDVPSPIAGRWKLANEAGSFGVGSKAGDPDWWTPNDNDLTARACFMDDVYIFGEYGSFANEQGDQTWLENWRTGSDDACGAPLAPHNGSVDGTFTYADNKITITGAGNYIGIAKAGNTYAYESGGVPASIEYTVESMNADKTAMTLAVKVTKDDGNIDYWTYKLVKDVPSPIAGRWKLANEAGSFGVGSKAGDPDWWTPNDNDLTARACFMDDVYIFGEYGSFANEQGDQTWLENWQSGSDDACGAPLAPHNGSVDGTFTYADNKITITGTGNYIGIAKAGNTYAYESGGLPASIEYTVESMNADKTAMTLAVKVTKDDGNIDYWTYKLVKEAEAEASPIAGNWTLAQEVGAAGVGPSAGNVEWWSLGAGDLTARACFMDDVYTFGADGSFSNVQGSETWIENWQSDSDDACGAPLALIMALLTVPLPMPITR